jgi:3-hydroxybutyryl-CoA dehydrogenase
MKIGLVGYGKMGTSIFRLLSSAGLEVTVLVRTEDQADRDNIRQRARLRRGLRLGLIDEPQFSKLFAAQKFTSHIEDLRDCEVVIETVPEDVETKARLFRQLETNIPPETTIVTNTSSLSINVLARRLHHSERFCGFHFFHPIPLTSVIEIIAGDSVSPRTVDRLCDLSRFLGRTPLVVRDGPGSVLNAILACECCEGLYILEQGLASPSEIDRIAGRFFRIGPCESLDIIGLDFFAQLFVRTLIVRPSGIKTPSLLFKLIADGRKGRDYGKGIFLYQNQQAENAAPGYYLDPHQGHSFGNASGDKEVIARRLLFALFLGALYVLERGLASPEVINLGVQDVLGMKDGPITLMRAMGKEKLEVELESLAQTVGPRFDPALADFV